MDTIDEEASRQLCSKDGKSRIKSVEKRRQYGKAYKRQVVEETLTGKESVSVVARRHDINTNLLFNWRKQYLAGRYDEEAGSSLIPISMTPMAEVSVLAEEPTQSRSDGARVEIVLSGGHRVVAEGSVSPAVLRTALEVLTA